MAKTELMILFLFGMLRTKIFIPQRDFGRPVAIFPVSLSLSQYSHTHAHTLCRMDIRATSVPSAVSSSIGPPPSAPAEVSSTTQQQRDPHSSADHVEGTMWRAQQGQVRCAVHVPRCYYPGEIWCDQCASCSLGRCRVYLHSISPSILTLLITQQLLLYRFHTTMDCNISDN